MACLPHKIPLLLILVSMYHPKELRTGRILGTGTVHDGLYYLDEGSDEVALAVKISPCQELLLLHHRLGHPSFAIVFILLSLTYVVRSSLYVMLVNLLNIQGFLTLVWV